MFAAGVGYLLTESLYGVIYGITMIYGIVVVATIGAEFERSKRKK